MILNCEVSQSDFSVLSAKLIIKLSKISFLCTYVDQMIKQQRFNVLAQPKFKIFSIFYPLFSKDSNDILKIYEPPKIYDKIPKYYQIVLTIIIYQANSVFQLHQHFELYH